MILALERCPKCGSPMSSPIPSRRSGMVVQTCRNNACLHTERTTRVEVKQGIPSPQHCQMFAPSTSQPPPRPVSDKGALSRFERAYAAGVVREAIKQNRQQVRQVEPMDGRAKQVGEDA